MPRAKKLSVKWKCEKEVHLVHNYSVTGREPRKNVLLTYYKLTSFLSDFPVFSKVSPIFLYFHKWYDVHQKWCCHIQNIWLVKRDNISRTKLFTLSKQTFPSHFSEAAYYLRFYRRKKKISGCYNCREFWSLLPGEPTMVV